MGTPAPVNPRGSAPAVLADFDHDGPIPAGHFHFVDGYDGTKDVGILFGCPCGCGSVGYIGIKPYGEARPLWTWDGNRETPTCTPSILRHQLNDRGEKIGEHWHGFLTAGQFVSC